ncbi:MAG: pyridoxal phosphate-dependent aminotransferase [Myxococcaceae bacterium]
MGFSRRTAWSRRLNPLSARLEALRREGREVLDLTLSNPTRCGFSYPEPEILRALADPAALRYEPDPFGQPAARAAVSTHLSRGGAEVAPGELVLTASTSEAYAWLFKLLCDPGDEVLVPAPSYPLFDFLTGLEAVEPRAYPLRFDGAWHLDAGEVAALVGERTRAVLVVNPGNPTGAFLKEGELAALNALCAARGLALICDEVFSDYGIGGSPERVRTVAGRKAPCLTFSLGGLSKAAGLPQLKLGWIALSGPAALKDEARARLELIADCYLSVNTPVQRALPQLLPLGRRVQAQLRERVVRNRAALLAARHGSAAWSVLPSEGGWSAVLRIGEQPGEQARCLSLLERGVLVHPGHFFDFPGGAWLVLSLIVPPGVFDRALGVLAPALDAPE